MRSLAGLAQFLVEARARPQKIFVDDRQNPATSRSDRLVEDGLDPILILVGIGNKDSFVVAHGLSPL